LLSETPKVRHAWTSAGRVGQQSADTFEKVASWLLKSATEKIDRSD
jgi:hypothetical protein